MIKANELRIGNYIDCNGKWVRVTYHELRLLTIGKTINGEPPNYNPIPLTPEILEKCGFDNYSNGVCFIKKYLQQGEVILFPTSGLGGRANGFPEGKFHFGINGIQKILEHLHQLQNLYYALTGEELQIDLSTFNS